MKATIFNPAQMRILQMMSFLKTPEQLANLENAISQDEGLDMLCENGTITLDTIEKWGKEHMRISRK